MTDRMAPLHVTLTEDQLSEALDEAMDRYRNAKMNGAEHVADFDGDPWEAEYNGCYGEQAFHVGLGLTWTHAPMRLPDASWFIQVRCAPCKKPRPPPGFGRLIIRPRYLNRRGKMVGDDPNDSFALVAGNAPHFVILGWIVGWQGITVGSWETPRNRPPAWFVDNRFLNKNLDELLRSRG